jgi:hypothetical protein
LKETKAIEHSQTSEPTQLRKIASSRDNGNDSEGVFKDRTLGTCTVQFTELPNPTAAKPANSFSNYFMSSLIQFAWAKSLVR